MVLESLSKICWSDLCGSICGLFHWCIWLSLCHTTLLIQFSSVQSLSRVWLFVTPWTAARQASLSITNSRSPPKPMSIESVMPSKHLILCCLLLLLASIFPSIRVFSNQSALCIRWPKYWSLHNIFLMWILILVFIISFLCGYYYSYFIMVKWGCKLFRWQTRDHTGAEIPLQTY